MTKRQRASETGLEPHFKVRVVVPGAMLHLASKTRPAWETQPDGQRALIAEWIDDPEYGDSIVEIEWSHVVAVTCRWSE